jgi:hypothetical protein
VATATARSSLTVLLPAVVAATLTAAAATTEAPTMEPTGGPAAAAVTELLKLLPYYRLNPSSGPLSHNTEVTRRLCRVVPGKSLTSQDRHLYNKLTRRRVQR